MIHTQNGSYGMGDITLPTLDQLLQAAQGAATAQVASAVASSPEFKAAAAKGAATTFGEKFYTFITTHKKELMIGGAIALVGIGIYLAKRK